MIRDRFERFLVSLLLAIALIVTLKVVFNYNGTPYEAMVLSMLSLIWMNLNDD